MEKLPRLSAAAREYVALFDLAAVAISASGRIMVTDNPASAVVAWWCRAADAQRVAAAARAADRDVIAAAARLGVPLTAHSVLVDRVGRQLARLDAVVDRARRDGTLRLFNRVYRARRAAAAVAGQSFMTYGQAERRLRAVLAGAVASKTMPVSLIAQVFG